MGSQKDFKSLEKRLERLGFTYVHTNSSSCYVYTHDQHADIVVNPTINEHAARILLSKVEKALGSRAATPKRNAANIKARHAEERRQLREEADRLDAERMRLLRTRDRLLEGAASHLTNAEIRDLERRVEEIGRERRAIESLMTERPAPSDRSVKHRAGQR